MASFREQEYIYSIMLPFQCTSRGPSKLDTDLKGLPPPPSESVVAKVGITKNREGLGPAVRLREIFNAFQEFGEQQPMLDSLSTSDDPQAVIATAKAIDNIIFIEGVQNQGTAEKDIRDKLVQTTVMHLGQPQITEEFRKSFEDKVPPEKKDYLKKVGMTEWIILSSSLAWNLRERFRRGGICQSWGRVPSGEELTRALYDCCHEFSFGKAPSQDRLILGGSGKCLPLLFEFTPLRFSFTLQCPLLRVERRKEPLD